MDHMALGMEEMGRDKDVMRRNREIGTWERTSACPSMVIHSTFYHHPNSLHVTPPREEMVRPRPSLCKTFSLYTILSF